MESLSSEHCSVATMYVWMGDGTPLNPFSVEHIQLPLFDTPGSNYMPLFSPTSGSSNASQSHN